MEIENKLNKEEAVEGKKSYSESLKIEGEWEDHGDYISAPVAFCSATVCNKVLKPWNEIKKTWKMWEGTPVTFGHPQEGIVQNPKDVIGQLVDVEEEPSMKRLNGELRVRKEPADYNTQKKAFWDVMVQEIKTRKEISIGYWAVPDYTKGSYTDEFGNKRDYEEIARQILPDHIASVENGACSPGQGCGIGVEGENTDGIENPYEVQVEDMEPVELEIEENEDGQEEKEEGEEDSMEDEKKSMLEKIHKKVDELLNHKDEEAPDEKKELNKADDSNMTEEEQEEEEENANEQEEPQPEQGCCAQNKELEEKIERIEELQDRVETLQEQLSEYREKEIEELQEKAEQLTGYAKEDLENKEQEELEALIEGAEAARSRENEGQEEAQEKNETGKNLRSPPGGSGNDVEKGPEVIDLYEDPLDED